jgi:sporulation protein YlmC with PRC-barrel domain
MAMEPIGDASWPPARAAPGREPPRGPGSHLIAASTMCGDKVVNGRDETLGTVIELMLDPELGHVAYAVMTVGGFMGVGEKLYAVPWRALQVDPDRRCFVLDAERSSFDAAPCFDKDHWPQQPDERWHRSVHAYYRSSPYWD